jgi:hypothetical protein
MSRRRHALAFATVKDATALIDIPTSAAGAVRSQGFQPWWRQARMA